MSFSFNKTVFAGMIGAAFLAACGGGGGSSPANQAPVAATSITSTNAPNAVAYAYASAQKLNNQGSVGSSLATAVSVQTSNSGLINASLQQLYKGLNALPANGLATGVSATETLACPTSGTLSVTATEASPPAISNGDGLSITANNCVDSGVTENGTITYTFSGVNGTIGSMDAWSATLALKYVNFSEVASGETLSANGDLTMAYTQSANAATSGATESGSSLAMNSTGTAGTYNRTLTAYNQSVQLTSTTSTFQTNYTVTGSAPVLGNTNFTVATTTPFESTSGNYPSVGSMTVTATDKSSATLTAVDSTNVTIVITDSKGNSTTINTTWAALNSLM